MDSLKSLGEDFTWIIEESVTEATSMDVEAEEKFVDDWHGTNKK
ncbi:hypothetical protein NPIL_156141, partial [Nephila pilipes]